MLHFFVSVTPRFSRARFAGLGPGDLVPTERNPFIFSNAYVSPDWAPAGVIFYSHFFCGNFSLAFSSGVEPLGFVAELGSALDSVLCVYCPSAEFKRAGLTVEGLAPCELSLPLEFRLDFVLGRRVRTVLPADKSRVPNALYIVFFFFGVAHQ